MTRNSPPTKVYMLPILHPPGRRRGLDLLNVIVRPSAACWRVILAQPAINPRQPTFFSAIRSRKSPMTSGAPSTVLPRGAWDSHVHVVDEEAFPFAQDHAFRPKEASVRELLEFEGMLGVDHVCLVAISVYGTDNRLLLQSLRQLGPKGRAVVSIDPETVSDTELDEMHALGVRGIRINLRSTSQNKTKEELSATLRLCVRRIHRLKWAIQLHISLADIERIAPEIPKLGLPVVIDHLATPDETLAPRLQPGYTHFMDLLSAKQIWVKLSGTYRFPSLPELDSYVREILRTAPSQVVWASDWPHTGGVAANPQGDRRALQEYRRFDVPAFIAECREWCGEDEALIQKLFVDNPRRLWQYEDED